MSLVVIITMTSCSADEDAQRIGDITPKSLLVQTSRVADTYVLDIKDVNDNIIETKIVFNKVQHIFNINTGSKFTLTIHVDSQTFNGSYHLTEDYGNDVILEDSFTQHFNSFSVTREY